MKKMFLLLLLLPFVFSCQKKTEDDDATPPPSDTQKDIAAIDNAVQSFMATYSIPGVSIAVTRQGKLVYAKSYGQMSASDNAPVTNASLFRIASVSKPVTAVGIMKLLESGKLTMDSKVFGPGSILGGDFPAAPAAVHDITVRHLLHHTVGVWGNDGTDPMFKQPGMNHSQLINWTLANYPATSGRGTYRYSNFGYTLLGRVIEKVSGKTYEQFIRDEVLTPSGITRMTIGGNTLADRKPGEVVYTGQGGFNPYAYNIARMDAHGGWIASATDLARFLVRVDGFPSKPDILQPATINTMVTPSVPSSQYASGWSVSTANHWWHTGGLPGTATEVIRSAKGFNWVVLCNSRSLNTSFNGALDNLLWPFINSPSTPWQDIDQF
ncbi:MAG TPA: serine hydrolase domain-containing protein [Chitinophagaceae bacterium]|jgi:CubicO group peptidase (beta-lactamase class C family)|nr:serine hydrolase domain-containing protein [Chitinophagaceae bacterium]